MSRLKKRASKSRKQGRESNGGGQVRKSRVYSIQCYIPDLDGEDKFVVLAAHGNAPVSVVIDEDAVTPTPPETKSYVDNQAKILADRYAKKRGRNFATASVFVERKAGLIGQLMVLSVWNQLGVRYRFQEPSLNHPLHKVAQDFDIKTLGLVDVKTTPPDSPATAERRAITRGWFLYNAEQLGFETENKERPDYVIIVKLDTWSHGRIMGFMSVNEVESLGLAPSGVARNDPAYGCRIDDSRIHPLSDLAFKLKDASA